MPPPSWVSLSQRPVPTSLSPTSRSGGLEPVLDEPAARPVLRPWYVVQSGDTLWSISLKTHVPVSKLEEWNGLDPEEWLHIGDVLIIDPVFPPPVSAHISKPAASNAARKVTGTLASRSGMAADEHVDDVATLGGAVAQYALRFLGVPYRWGGTSPTGFDCSGFVQYVYAHFGVNVPRTSEEQFHIGAAVSFRDLAPGDLVFFDASGPGPTHVGIYIGQNTFVDAGSSGVHQDSFSLAYWRAHYIGARRVMTGG
jgi:peptidoglycan endopeptidase LytE